MTLVGVKILQMQISEKFANQKMHKNDRNLYFGT